MPPSLSDEGEDIPLVLQQRGEIPQILRNKQPQAMDGEGVQAQEHRKDTRGH